MTIEKSKERHVCPNCQGFITYKANGFFICPKDTCPVMILYRDKDESTGVVVTKVALSAGY